MSDMPGPAAAAETIPSMGGTEIGAVLRRFAAAVPDGGTIVEVGCWLGAGTAQLALGAGGRGIAIHTYDLWTASEQEVEVARAQGVDLAVGQDTLPFVRGLLAPFGDTITFHKGPIAGIAWAGGPIALYVDDAAKDPADFHHVLRSFGPSWIPGQTVLVLMDYTFWTQCQGYARRFYQAQQRFIAAHPEHFRPITDIGRLIPGHGEIEGTETTTHAFLYARVFDFARLPPFRPPVHWRAMVPAALRRPLRRAAALFG